MKLEHLRSYPPPSALEFFFLVVGLFFSAHYAWLLDDAYIYFRYVDNWVLLDRGLVFNSGEYAEGFTSPGWLLALSALRWLGMDFWLAVRALAAVGFTLFWYLAVAINRRLSPARAPALNLPLAILSTNYAVLCYFSSGTESPVVLVAAAAYALFVLQPRARWAAAVVALSPLIRPELAAPLIGALAWARWRTGSMPWMTIALAAAGNGGWLLFRVIYYADFFPTTYYLKSTFEPLQGLLYLHDTLLPYHLYEVGLVALVTIMLLARNRSVPQLRERGVLFAMAALILVYVVKVGGDARHFRYVAFPICLLLLSLGGVAEQVCSRMPRAIALAGVVVLAALSFSFHPRQLQKHPLLRDQELELVDLIADAAHHRQHPALPTLEAWGNGSVIELRPLYGRWLSEPNAGGSSEVFVHSICWKHYQRFRARSVHSHGLTDPVLARVKLPWRRPGHRLGLRHLAQDLGEVYRWWARQPGRGMFRAASEAGIAADWINTHLETIEVIERKTYNRHRLFENLGLALTRLDPIGPGDPGDRRE